MVLSKCSELFILTEKLNNGLPISLMHQNSIENRSRILDGTLMSTTEVLSSVAVIEKCQDRKEEFREDIFFFRYSLLFALNLNR
jgi:hypothetical protein